MEDSYSKIQPEFLHRAWKVSNLENDYIEKRNAVKILETTLARLKKAPEIDYLNQYDEDESIFKISTVVLALLTAFSVVALFGVFSLGGNMEKLSFLIGAVPLVVLIVATCITYSRTYWNLKSSLDDHWMKMLAIPLALSRRSLNSKAKAQEGRSLVFTEEQLRNIDKVEKSIGLAGKDFKKVSNGLKIIVDTYNAEDNEYVASINEKAASSPIVIVEKSRGLQGKHYELAPYIEPGE